MIWGNVELKWINNSYDKYNVSECVTGWTGFPTFVKNSEYLKSFVASFVVNLQLLSYTIYIWSYCFVTKQ